MTQEVLVKVSEPYKPLYNLPADTSIVICIGGRGGMKTYEVSKFIAYSTTIKKKRCVIIRDEKALIKESILNEVWTRYDNANVNGILDAHYDKNETELKDKKTGNTLIYTKGFRASNNSKRANLKGASDIDIAVMEEGEDIVDQDKFNTFIDSLRKVGCVVIVMMNTPDVGHFLVKNYFNCVPARDEKGEVLDGFFEIIPKQIPGFLCIQTSFEDNPYLPAHIVDRYRAYGNPESHLYNPFYYYTAIKGYASTGRKGQVLTKVKPIKLEDYLKLPFKEYYGQDFGTASPAGFVGVKFDKNNCYCREINYLPMVTKEIGKMYCRLKLDLSDRIIADNADEKSCRKLKKGYQMEELDQDDIRTYPGLMRGFTVVPCIKGTDSVTFGIDLMSTMNLYAVEESKNLWNEIMNYVYAQDKNGNNTNEPIDDFNHLIDPWRYVVNDQRGKGRGSGSIEV